MTREQKIEKALRNLVENARPPEHFDNELSVNLIVLTRELREAHAALSEPVTPPTRDERMTDEDVDRNIAELVAAWGDNPRTNRLIGELRRARSAEAEVERFRQYGFTVETALDTRRMLGDVQTKLETAEAERDALKARVAELERVISKSEPNK